MSNLICHCCGASNSPNPDVSIIKCTYCKSELSVLDFYKDLSLNSLKSLEEADLSEDEQKNISRLMSDAETFLQVNDFNTAKLRFEEILKIYPQNIISRLQIAKCILQDISIEKKERFESVLKYCNLVKMNNLEPEIVEILKSISFDLASLAKFSTNGLEALDFFEISKECFNDNPERDELIYDFLKPKYDDFKNKIYSNFNKNKNYSPSITEISIAISYYKHLVEGKGLCLSIYDWININKKTIHPRSLEKMDDLKKASIDYVGKYESFEKKLFGIKQVTKSL